MAQRILVVDDSALVRKVAARTLERAGYDVALAADGREALERVHERVPDLLLVDFVMPHVNGLLLCQQLRQIANARHVPVVLMSAKADRIAEQFIAQTGALDAISKPFGPEALLAVTTNALARVRDRTTEQRAPGRTDRPPPRDTLVPGVRLRRAQERVAEVGLGGETERPPPGEGRFDEDTYTFRNLDEEVARLGTAKAIAEKLSESMTLALGELGLEMPSADAVASALAARVGHDALYELASELGRLAPSKIGAASFEGNLEHVPLGDVLQLLHHQRQTGVLELTQNDRSVTVCIRDGLVDIALGRPASPEFLLGRYLVEDDLLDRSELEALLRARSPSRRLLGTQLVKLGYITQDDLRQTLIRQTSELVYEALRWSGGRFTFERLAAPPEAADARLGLPMSAILMEGLRRVDEWRLIEEQVRSFEIVPVVRRDALTQEMRQSFSGDELRVLDAIDGERTVRELIADTEMSSFETCKVLFQLMTSGLVRASG